VLRSYPVVANLAPSVSITSPGDGSSVETGSDLTITIRADDDSGQNPVGVAEISYQATGGVLGGGSLAVFPTRDLAVRSFVLPIPANAIVGETIEIDARARDVFGHEAGTSISVPLNACLPRMTICVSPLVTSAPIDRNMRSVWSRVVFGSTIDVSPSANSPASKIADFTCALATGSR
jgi:hypothetical protein